METKDLVLIGIVVVYVLIAYLFSRLGKYREIGTRRLFILSLLLTPVIGIAFLASSQHRKLNLYTEERFKCEECGYVFSEEHDNCPFCEKEGKQSQLKPVSMFMT
ncbi:MAG: hypothetical protein K9G76_01265 [Bacteroidales bacterium]|nr:hypothetical protein [Bacteroidales bacterium]MCF8403181.1 hypothetical protein [Bacteroidales bacterium]